MSQTSTAIELAPVEVRFNPDTKRLEAWGQRWRVQGRDEPGPMESRDAQVLLLSCEDPDEFNSTLQLMCLHSLEARLRPEVEDKIVAVLKTLPYPQECLCQDYPRRQALDCHVHNDHPRHFFGDFEFPCTCHDQ